MEIRGREYSDWIEYLDERLEYMKPEYHLGYMMKDRQVVEKPKPAPEKKKKPKK